MISFTPHPPGYKRPPPPPRFTVDDVELKIGDIAWCVRFGAITRCKVSHDTLRYFGRYEGCLYSTERQAVTVALAGAKTRLKKAKQQVRRETRSIARLEARLSP